MSTLAHLPPAYPPFRLTGAASTTVSIDDTGNEHKGNQGRQYIQFLSHACLPACLVGRHLSAEVPLHHSLAGMI